MKRSFKGKVLRDTWYHKRSAHVQGLGEGDGFLLWTKEERSRDLRIRDSRSV